MQVETPYPNFKCENICGKYIQNNGYKYGPFIICESCYFRIMNKFNYNIHVGYYKRLKNFLHQNIKKLKQI